MRWVFNWRTEGFFNVHSSIVALRIFISNGSAIDVVPLSARVKSVVFHQLVQHLLIVLHLTLFLDKSSMSIILILILTFSMRSVVKFYDGVGHSVIACSVRLRNLSISCWVCLHRRRHEHVRYIGINLIQSIFQSITIKISLNFN